MPRRTAALLGAAGKTRTTGGGGDGGGDDGGTPTQTLGVGGVATPPGAILATSDQPGVQLNITTSGTATQRRVYDGQGHKIGQVKIRASYVTVQNYRIEAQVQYGVDCKLGTSNHDVIIQNNDIKDVRPSGDGDLNAMTINGNDIKILYNTAINFVGQESPGSHTDAIQTWNDGPGDESTSNLYVIGNRFQGPPAETDSPTYQHIHQALIGEGKDSTDGGGGGTGVSQNWFIADNYFTADCKFDDIDNVTFTRNTFAGIDKRVVVVSSLSSGFKYYSDNVVTGSYSVGIGAPVISGPGPATPTFGASSPDGTQAAALYGWGAPLSSSDEFNYTGAPDSTKWSVYDSAGHAGNGVRSPARVSVAAGTMTLTGLAGSANTAGMAHALTRTYGRYEIRCRSFYTSSPTTPGTLSGGYHPVLIIWPANDDWPANGELDFLENGEPGEQTAGAFMHYPSLDGSDHADEMPGYSVDLRDWHNFAFEWSSTGVKAWVDGNPWYTLSGGAASDRKNIQAMVGGQLTVQLDAFQASSCIASTFELEWVRIYAAP